MNAEIMMDDESYFKFKNNQTPGNYGFMTLDKENTPPTARFKTKQNIERRC